VVDDASADNTADVMREYINKDNRFQYHQRPINKIKGPNSCRNYGFELSNGEYIKWFDSDDVMLPYLLEKQVLSFAKNVEMSVCKLSYFDFERKVPIKENIIFSKNSIEDYLIGNITFYISGPLWKRIFLEKQNQFFDESLTNLDDWDFNLRMLYQKPNVAYINEILILYRVHADSLSQEIAKSNFKEIQSEFEARRKHLKLLKINKLANPSILQGYIKERCKFIFREAMIAKDKNKYYYLKMLVVSQLKMLNFIGFFKTIFGFIVFSLSNTGYKLLK
jgi:glycosyltransferase involved in cell wall biosynthesis